MVHTAVLLITCLGFALLARSGSKGMWRQHKACFVPGWLMLLTALFVALQTWGGALGLTFWTGHLSLGAGVVFIFRLSARRVSEVRETSIL